MIVFLLKLSLDILALFIIVSMGIYLVFAVCGIDLDEVLLEWRTRRLMLRAQKKFLDEYERAQGHRPWVIDNRTGRRVA